MNIKVPVGVSSDIKYLSSLFDRQEQLEMFSWIVHLNVAVRFPWVISLLWSSQQSRRGMGDGVREQMGLTGNFNEDSLMA